MTTSNLIEIYYFNARHWAWVNMMYIQSIELVMSDIFGMQVPESLEYLRDHSSSLPLRDRSLFPHVFENIVTFKTLSNYIYIRIVLKYFN